MKSPRFNLSVPDSLQKLNWEFLKGVFLKNPEIRMLMVMTGILVGNIMLLLLPLTWINLNASHRLQALGREHQKALDDTGMDEKIQAKLEEWKGKLESYERTLAQGDVSLYLETLSDMARESGVRIRTVKPTADDSSPWEIKSKAYSTATFEVSAGAGYHELGDFISRIENSRIFMKVMRLVVRANPQDTREHDISILIRMLRKAGSDFV